MTDVIEPLSDEDFDKLMLSELNATQFSILDLHGQLMDAWYADVTVGPLVLFVYDKILMPTYQEEIDRRYNAINMLALYVDSTNAQEAYHVIILTHQEFGAIGLFGQELTASQFLQVLSQAQQEIDENNRNNS